MSLPLTCHVGRLATGTHDIANIVYLRQGLRLNAAMGILSLLYWAKSRHAGGKPDGDFERVAREMTLLPAKSAFDVAVEEDRRADANAWAKLERGLKP
jgi:hypothetical protein